MKSRKDEVDLLLQIIRKSELEETVKWGAPVFCLNGKNVVSAGGFKNFSAIWFYNGVFLKDPLKVLITASEGKTKALRQWRFTDINQIRENDIMAYIQEAIQNEKEGKALPKETPKPVGELPNEILLLLESNKKLNANWNNLTPYKQKEYIEFISSAKREETRKNRLEKMCQLLAEGKGLYDKYK